MAATTGEQHSTCRARGVVPHAYGRIITRGLVVGWIAAAALLGVAGPASAGVARIVGERQLDARVVELTIATPAFTAPTHVDVDLPTRYRVDPRRRWPVTYYLAGTNHVFSDFNNEYAGERLTQSFPSIVVSPNGDSGYWSDWYNAGAFGAPMYETFVIDQLIPLIDATFRTIPARSQRAVMGESMGGDGAMMLAARHPDLFAAASSLSGAVDTNYLPGAAVLSASPMAQGAPPDSIYGPRATQEVRWHGHNPTDLAANLRGVDLQVRSAEGAYNLSNSQAGSGPGCEIEAGVYTESSDFHAALDSLGIPNLFHVYPDGCHDIALFEREITDSLPQFERVFAHPHPAPKTFGYESIEPHFTISGWHIDNDPQRALEFMQIQRAGRAGLTLTGSGTATVTTPPFFPGVRAVQIRTMTATKVAMPDAAGRLHFSVDLGPADRDQQYTSGAGTNFTTRTVTFTPRRRPARVNRSHGKRHRRAYARGHGTHR